MAGRPGLTRRAACGAILATAAGCATSANSRAPVQHQPSRAPMPITPPAAAASAAAPIVLSTWNHGLPANRAGLEVLRVRGGTALDAVEAGCRVVELDCPDMTVGLGSRPDREGRVTLDAAIMSDDGRAGCVAFVQGVAHPISLARLVMERTPHVLLVGAGAEQFARASGVEVAAPALTPAAEREWRAWLAEQRYEPKINIENHDTISMLALDRHGRMAAASTTSGLAYKMHGRVGDSPIIGAGIFVDAPVGGAICTGLGETVLRTLGSHLAVEAMRAGASPQEACERAIARIIEKNPNPENYQVGMLALDFSGRVGAYAVQKGFSFALQDALHDAPSKFA
ncbi:MAG: isoaspartyl peptidase/L-asparaginase family protein [Phycisphaerales bacterium]